MGLAYRLLLRIWELNLKDIIEATHSKFDEKELNIEK